MEVSLRWVAPKRYFLNMHTGQNVSKYSRGTVKYLNHSSYIQRLSCIHGTAKTTRFSKQKSVKYALPDPSVRLGMTSVRLGGNRVRSRLDPGACAHLVYISSFFSIVHAFNSSSCIHVYSLRIITYVCLEVLE